MSTRTYLESPVDRPRPTCAIIVWRVEGEGYYALRTEEGQFESGWNDPAYYCGPADTPEEALSWVNA